MYFGLTTLSTVGLGDFYPVTNFERLVGSVFLFCGFIVMSLVTGILLESADKVTELFAEIEEQEQLDKFFALLKAYNKNYDLDRDLQ